jgi:hypothetical protein
MKIDHWKIKDSPKIIVIENRVTGKSPKFYQFIFLVVISCKLCRVPQKLLPPRARRSAKTVGW